LRVYAALSFAVLLWGATSYAHGTGIVDRYPAAREFFPQATDFGELQGTPPAAAVYQGEHLLGYVFLTKDVFQIPAYSGKPINSLVGIDTRGRITGVRIVAHEEPILVVGVTPKHLRQFTDQYRGKSVSDHIAIGGSMRRGDVVIDSITGASITAMVENATVMKSAQRIAESRGIGKAA
jgi:NosR/NirI family nitrous oxide reductase transcriptional regulator